MDASCLAVVGYRKLTHPSHARSILFAGQRESEGNIKLAMLGPLGVMMSVEAGAGIPIHPLECRSCDSAVLWLYYCLFTYY